MATISSNLESEDYQSRKIDFLQLNENIHNNLKAIVEYPRNAFLKDRIIIQNTDNLPYNPKHALVDIMIQEELIEYDPEHKFYLNPTKKGYKVYRTGGWLKYLEREKRNSDRNDKKNIYDYNLSKWKYRTFWPLFILGAFGGFYSAYDIFSKNVEKKEVLSEKLEKFENSKSKSQDSDSLKIDKIE